MCIVDVDTKCSDLADARFLACHQPVLLWLRTQMADLARICAGIEDADDQAWMHASGARQIATAATARLTAAETVADLDHKALDLVKIGFEAADYLDLHNAGFRNRSEGVALKAFVAGMRPCTGVAAREAEFTAYFGMRRDLLNAVVHERHDRLFTLVSGAREVADMRRNGFRAIGPNPRHQQYRIAWFAANDAAMIAAMGGASILRLREDTVFAVDARGLDVVRFPFRSGSGAVRHILADIPASRLSLVGRFDHDRGYEPASPVGGHPNTPAPAGFPA